MKFYPRRRRQAPTIIIISLIDVLIVMLVFLLMSTTFRNQPAVRISLPESTQPPRPGAGNEPPPLVVTIAKEEPRYYLGKRPLTLTALASELEAAAGTNAKPKLILRADEDAAWRHVAKVIEIARQAKISDIKTFMKSPGGGL